MPLYSPLGPETVSSLIRKHVHDLRNCINYLDLEISLLEEEATDINQSFNVSLLRGQLNKLEHLGQVLNLRFSLPSLAEVAVGDVWARWQRTMENLHPAVKVQWLCECEQGLIRTDLHALTHLLAEVLGSFHDPDEVAPLNAQMMRQDNQVVFCIDHPLQADMENLAAMNQNGGLCERELQVRMAEMAGGKWRERASEQPGKRTVEISFDTPQSEN